MTSAPSPSVIECCPFGGQVCTTEGENCILWGIAWQQFTIAATVFFIGLGYKYLCQFLFAIVQFVLGKYKRGTWFQPIYAKMFKWSKLLILFGFVLLSYSLLRVEDNNKSVNDVLIWFFIIPLFTVWLIWTSVLFDTIAIIVEIDLRERVEKATSESKKKELTDRLRTTSSAYKEGIRVMKYVAFLFIIVIGLSSQNVDVIDFLNTASLVALAFVFAVQPWLRNMIGGIFIFTDSKFTVNDEIRVMGIEGSVVGVTLRHTKVRRADNAIVYVPNSRVLEHPVANYSDRESRLLEIRLKISQDTPAAKIRELLSELERVLHSLHPTLTSHPKNQHSGDFFVALGGLFEVLIWTYTNVDDLSDKPHSVIKTEIMLAVRETFENLGVEIDAPLTSFLEGENDAEATKRLGMPERKLLEKKQVPEKPFSYYEREEDYDSDDVDGVITLTAVLSERQL
mmetsp:Transcript_19599/g.25413  ORF Transcript_19599/g.25413 Transcript_19599/m.25413 type:complete len:453 (+) Transcript_19599:120-1478(+)